MKIWQKSFPIYTLAFISLVRVVIAGWTDSGTDLYTIGEQVGIGVTDPTQALHVYHDSGGTYSNIARFQSPYSNYHFNDTMLWIESTITGGSPQLKIVDKDSSDARMIIEARGGGGNTPGLFLSSTGKLAIYSTEPKERFRIGDRFFFHDGGWEGFSFNAFFQGGNWLRQTDGFNAQIMWDSYAGALRFRMGESDVAGSVVNGSDVLFIGNTGFIGVNTTTPDYELDVNGTARAKEIIVESNWADFVFEEDYELMPLEEVAAVIQAEKRLPGVKSAKEIHAEGASVGETQAMLLQKVEELTLYVIQVHEENQTLKQRIRELEETR